MTPDDLQKAANAFENLRRARRLQMYLDRIREGGDADRARLQPAIGNIDPHREEESRNREFVEVLDFMRRQNTDSEIYAQFAALRLEVVERLRAIFIEWEKRELDKTAGIKIEFPASV